MIHVAAFSGGKDSTALLCWLRDQGIAFTAVFCDTGWEHPLTYAYIEEINQRLLEGRLVVLRSDRYTGMEDLVARKKRVPSAKARFCTEKLKVLPLIGFLRGLADEATLYQGIRAGESPARARLPESEWSDDYDCWVWRPLLRWAAADCFALLASHGIEPNPLYRLGAGRVGCFPCVLVSHGELKRLTQTMPEVWDRIEHLEAIAKGSTPRGGSFFPPNYIPPQFCLGRDVQGRSFPTAADVRRYLIETNEAQLALFEGMRPHAAACLSIYNLCE